MYQITLEKDNKLCMLEIKNKDKNNMEYISSLYKKAIHSLDMSISKKCLTDKQGFCLNEKCGISKHNYINYEKEIS